MCPTYESLTLHKRKMIFTTVHLTLFETRLNCSRDTIEWMHALGDTREWEGVSVCLRNSHD